MTKRRMVVGWLLAALLVAANVSAVGAAVPEAVGSLPVAVGAGAGVRPDGTIPNGGTRGLDRSTIQRPNFIGTQTNVSAIPSNNPNETAALYRPGGTYAIFFEETKAVTQSEPRYFFRAGIATTGNVGSSVSFVFNGNITRFQTSQGVVNFLYTSNSTQGGNTQPIGSRINATFPAPNGQVLTETVTLLSRTSINSLLPQGFYVIRDPQSIQIAGNRTTGLVNIQGNAALVVAYDGLEQQYDANGVAIYQTELVKPPTFNPPNGTTTGEPTAADVVGPYFTTGKISVFAPDFASFGTSSIGPTGQSFTTIPLPSRP